MKPEPAQHLAAPNVPAAPGADGALSAERPWPGMRPYREQDAGFYFGREAEVEDLLMRTERSRLTLLYARGGLGKTSLVRAGLAPRLVERGYLPVYLRPRGLLDGGREPTGEAIRAVAAAARGAGIEATAAFEASSLWELFHRHDFDLWDATNRLVTPVLVFDQFEEIFQIIDDDPGAAPRVRALLQGIAELVENRLPQRLAGGDLADGPAHRFDVAAKAHRVVLSFREDYLPQVRKLRAIVPSVIENHVRLEPLTGRQALQVVERAGGELVDREAAMLLVRSVGRSAGLLQRLLEPDAGLAGGGEVVNVEVEPAVLSVVCFHLNAERLQRGRPTIDVGLVKRKSAEDIFDDYYRANIGRVPMATRRFVESSLVTPGGERVLYLMRAVEAQGPALARGIGQLIEQGILRKEWFAGEQRVEISHDLLLRPINRALGVRRRLRNGWLAGAAIAVLLGASWYANRLEVRAETQRREAEVRAERERREAEVRILLDRKQTVVEALLVAYLPFASRDEMARLIDNVRNAGGDRQLVDDIDRVFDWSLERSMAGGLDPDTSRQLQQKAIEYAQIAIDRSQLGEEQTAPLLAKLRGAVTESCAKGLAFQDDQSVVWFERRGLEPVRCP